MLGHRPHFLRRESGASAIELAIILPILVIVLSAPLFVAVYFWHYTAVNKAAQDAARYLSTLTEQEMREPALSEAAARIAIQIAEAEVEGLGSPTNRPRIRVFCGQTKLCEGVRGAELPETVTVTIDLELRDTIFGKVNTGRYGWAVSGRSEIDYAP